MIYFDRLSQMLVMRSYLLSFPVSVRCFLVMLLPMIAQPSLEAGTPRFDQDLPTKTTKNLKPTIKSKKSDRANHMKGSAESDERNMGLAITAGFGATYGNGVAINFDPLTLLRTQIGAGYNSTGFKSGCATAAVIRITDSLDLIAGAALAHSFGIKDEVSLPAKFTSEDSTSTEKIKAIRKFRMSPGNYYSIMAGPSYAILPQLFLDVQVNYNKVISGHNIDFEDTVSYDRPIEATNEDSVYQKFDKKARDKLAVTGLGFNAGVQFRF